jgi:hypothetical protein
VHSTHSGERNAERRHCRHRRQTGRFFNAWLKNEPPRHKCPISTEPFSRRDRTSPELIVVHADGTATPDLPCHSMQRNGIPPSASPPASDAAAKLVEWQRARQSHLGDIVYIRVGLTDSDSSAGGGIPQECRWAGPTEDGVNTPLHVIGRRRCRRHPAGRNNPNLPAFITWMLVDDRTPREQAIIK